MKMNQILHSTRSRWKATLLVAAAAGALTINTQAAGKGGDKGQFQTRFFEVTITECVMDGLGEEYYPDPTPVFWHDPNADVRIGRIQDGTDPRILINQIVCGGLTPCLPALINPVNLKDTTTGPGGLDNLDTACFPGDEVFDYNGNESGTAIFQSDGKLFKMQFSALGITGKGQQYEFKADSVPLQTLPAEWTFLDLDPHNSIDFKLTNWSLGAAPGTGKASNACTGAGTLTSDDASRAVIVSVKRVK